MLERYKNETMLVKKEKKFWVPEVLTIAQLGVKIRYVVTVVCVCVCVAQDFMHHFIIVQM